jgi:formate hydrogenlyase transcriptional activator
MLISELKSLWAGTAAGRAIEEQRTIYVPDIRREMSHFPDTASQTSNSELSSAYIVPISTPRRKLGALYFGRREEGEVGADEIALMEAVASHVGTALESALESDAAESYQRQLLAERDRWKLLLEINNHVISRLDVKGLFRAACASIREYFDNDFRRGLDHRQGPESLAVGGIGFSSQQRLYG